MDYEYVKNNIYKTPQNELEWQNTFNKLLHAYEISLKEDDGTYKNMDEILGDITISYLRFQHDTNGQRFCGL